MNEIQRTVNDSRLSKDDQILLSPIEEIIEEARNGKMFILVDDEDRENEGDLIIPAQFATPDSVNFMAKEGRGLICLAMASDIANHLGLTLVGNRNNRHSTAFTVSIEAREGVTTGISAADRARTIQAAIGEDASADDIVSPGHIFPLKARDGGVLVRVGHTEAAVDISKLAGLRHAGVICEIMSDNGEMARLPELVKFAKTHDMKIGTIADLVAYRRKSEKLVIRVTNTQVNYKDTTLKYHVYKDTVSNIEHIALVKGEIKEDATIAVRVHSLDIASDVLLLNDSSLHKGIERICEHENGVFILMKEHCLTSNSIQDDDNNTKNSNDIFRDYGVGAHILKDIGVKNMILYSNSNINLAGLAGYNLNIVEQRKI